ncbi:hypothetical protein [Phormidium tenue]|uniref:Uncharacterized protein n=1 Tax=Phormidium tenue FACHB-1050 TaxID=2692857 RepID=A0ABR8CD42_9CYAN|nr:hypothetical protein [Phormidium tenue]MBD2317429.1 hypothetical protein [Phormidium tenue FACHB-1050]
MKISSLLSASAIATSTLLTFSTAAIAISQPKNTTTNLELSGIRMLGGCPRHLPSCGWW